MGKNKNKSASWDGKNNAYDYLKSKFENNYQSHNRSDRESSAIYQSKKNDAFQRYMMTGEMYTGHDKIVNDLIKKKKSKKEEDKSVTGQLFKAGIPPSQWQHYANKAGITNVNSASDAENIISAYNNEERFTKDDAKKDFATIKDINALRDDLEAQEEVTQKQTQPIEKSDALARAEDRLSKYRRDFSSIYEQNNADAATDNPPADASKHFLYDYRDKVKEKYGPLTNTEREVSNAAKRVQDAYGR